MKTPADDVFDQFWQSIVPFPWNANATIKARARMCWNQALDQLARSAGTPPGIQTAAAMLKIGRILLSAKVILNDPSPDPEKIATAVQALVERLKIETPGDATP